MDSRRRDVLTRFAAVAASSIAMRLLAADSVPLCGTHKIPHSDDVGAMSGGCSVLTADQQTMVTLLADHVIPDTDTPGAAKAGVGPFIDHMVTDWYTPEERRIFLAGLADLDDYCRGEFKLAFTACTSEQQIAALASAEHAMGPYQSPPANFPGEPDHRSPFFYKLKELTVIGYYTSEVGATTELSYNPVPGHFDGDVNYATLGREWST